MSVLMKLDEYQRAAQTPCSIQIHSNRQKTIKGDRISVNYRGTLYKDDKEFDSSFAR